MREIKFRVWDKESKTMNRVRRLDFLGNRVKTNNNIDFVLNMNDKENQNIELMQYTGLKDKNGKEIYEGDIFISDNGTKYEVCFIDGGFKLSNMKYPNQNLQLLERIIANYGEVIGNIYENEDLLEK